MESLDPRVGQVVGSKYRIEELIAHGGMGLVYGARHLVTDRSVAIKLLRSEFLNRPELVFRVSGEGRLAATAAHPNVVEVLDAGTDDGVPYLVQERLRGQPLEAFLTAPLSLCATVEALMPVINAVAHLHRSGLIHRDIKPTNIFLAREADGRLTPKLLDFGIAKALHAKDRTLSGVALGTPAYMAPEQALGSRTLGTASDVWSMAVVLVRCLTGQLPFSGNAASRANTLRLVAADMACIPEPIARVVSDALTLEPSERLRDMSIFRANLSAALRQVDASYAWPDDASVNYTGDPEELERALARGAQSRSAIAGAHSAPSASVRARPLHVCTRTLLERRQFSFAARARNKRVLLLSVLLALGALALRHAVNGSPPSESIAVPASPHASLKPTEPLALASAPIQVNADPPRPHDSAPASIRSSREPAIPQRPRQPSPVPRAAPTSRVLGANRSPIID